MNASEKYLNRLDYWKMVMDMSEEGSGTRAVAQRMVEKYNIKRLAALQREWEEKHEKGDSDLMGAEGGAGYTDAGTGNEILSAREQMGDDDAAGADGRK